MKTKKRLILPVLISLCLLGCLIWGGWMWYDNNVDRSGWTEKDGVRFYRDFHADPVSGWLQLEEGRYYFHPDGTPHTGWHDIDGQTYYFGDSGIMHTGWLKLDGKTHYFGGNGHMIEGWVWLEEGRYYLRDGSLLTGWQEIDGGKFYFDEQGIAAIGFAQIDGSTYYFNDGILMTGLTEIDGNHYFFAEDGTMHTGWRETNFGTTYHRDDGTQVFGWEEIDGTRYYFDTTGVRANPGWLYIDEYAYYLDENCTPVTGKQVIDGQTRYFSPKGIEVVLVNAKNPVPSYYTLNLMQVPDEGDQQVDQRCYYALMQMLADCKAAGIDYEFNSGYRTIEYQTAILEYRTLSHMETYDISFEEARRMALDTVAIPGTSEHHLGLAVDLLGDDAIAWFREHCWDYGFIIRYTEEKEDITGIVDEPWHFRYVGTEVSLDIKDTGLCLEEYLGAEAVGSDIYYE